MRDGRGTPARQVHRRLAVARLAQAAKAKAKAAAKPAAAAGASALARSLVDTSPGKKLPQAAAVKQQAHPLAPGAGGAAPSAGGFRFDTPSPDDVVLAAQQHRGGGSALAAAAAAAASGGPAPSSSSSSKAQRTPPAAAAPSAGLAGLQLGGGGGKSTTTPPSPPPPRSLGDYRMEPELAAACAAAAAAEAESAGGKPRLHLVVLGHVDAGKSTLMGRLLYELGLINDKTVHKTQREAAAAGKASFAWAWMLDERPEERARGVTVDVAMTRFETPARSVTLLDAPGHRDFVPNMIAGAAQADAALLVVDGSPGGFESGFAPAAAGAPQGGGQTREHAQLARSLGVDQLAVVVTKLDTCQCSEARFLEVRAALEPFLLQCGFRAGAVRWLPAVGPTGDNLAAPPADPRLAAWHAGPTLVQAIDAFAPRRRAVHLPLRLPVADVLSRGAKGAVVVGGKLEGGALRPGSKVLVLPSREAGVVKSIEVDGAPAALARAGDTADVVLAGVDPGAVGPGSVLCHPDFPAPLAAKFRARVVVLDVAIPVLRGQQVTLHAHAAREAGHVSALLELLDARTGEVVRARPRCLLRGQAAVVEVTPARAVCLEEYAACAALGRVALREGGRTIAVGVVTAVTSA
jgi:elongation factor 1 alpha-like protein